MVHGLCSLNIFYDLFKCLRFLKGCLMLFCSSHLTYKKIKEKTHAHTSDCFYLKNHRQSFFLNHLFLQFNSRINRGFYFCE